MTILFQILHFLLAKIKFLKSYDVQYPKGLPNIRGMPALINVVVDKKSNRDSLIFIKEIKFF